MPHGNRIQEPMTFHYTPYQYLKEIKTKTQNNSHPEDIPMLNTINTVPNTGTYRQFQTGLINALFRKAR